MIKKKVRWQRRPRAPRAPRIPGERQLSGAAIARLAGISKQRVSVLLAQGRSPDEIITEQWEKKAAGMSRRAPEGAA